FLPASMSPRTHVWVSRVTVLAMSAAAIALALWQPPSVLSMALYATTILGSSFAPAYICAVWWKKANSVGALASIIAGAVASVSWDVVGLTA
ncbi:sodium:solute symporter family transporter, partial [Bacteroides thetaiotaomicron]|uniref:sodium:solute symporter family transporter n=3 Tax=Bacteria TaxID=2 RepID=UPI001D1F4001|nr:sodium/proline symporter [Bacteroides thetaiotaomicron]